MLSTTAIGIRNIGIMEIMICTVCPRPIKSPMVQMMLTIATIIGLTISETFLKKKSIRRNIMSPASGALTAICLNISVPKGIFGHGKPCYVVDLAPPVARYDLFYLD